MHIDFCDMKWVSGFGDSFTYLSKYRKGMGKKFVKSETPGGFRVAGWLLTAKFRENGSVADVADPLGRADPRLLDNSDWMSQVPGSLFANYRSRWDLLWVSEHNVLRKHLHLHPNKITACGNWNLLIVKNVWHIHSFQMENLTVRMYTVQTDNTLLF